jgi:hypothetical protein
MVEGVQSHLSIVDLGTLISIILEMHAQFRTPPPVKGRMERGLQNETSAAYLGGQISVIRKCLLIKMTRPPSKLWKKGFFESLSLPKGMLLSGEHPLHDYVVTETTDDNRKIKWDNRSDEAHGLIKMSISPDLKFHLKEIDDLDEALENIETVFGKISII